MSWEPYSRDQRDLLFSYVFYVVDYTVDEGIVTIPSGKHFLAMLAGFVMLGSCAVFVSPMATDSRMA
jgi:hypothetical protein